MAISYRQKAVLSCQDPARSYDSVLVTVTATMGNGSALVAAGTEAALLDVASVTGFIDDPKFDEGFYSVGDVILVPVCNLDAIVNSSVVKYSDVQDGLSGAQITALQDVVITRGIKLQAAETDFSRLQ